DTGADQGLVADELAGEADQDRREGSEPRTLCRLPNGGGRHPTTNVPGDSAADRGTTAAATTRASMKRLIVTRVQAQSTGGMRPDASENSQISPSTIARAARAAGSHPHLASVLLQGRKSVNIHASSGVIRGIPVKRDPRRLKRGGRVSDTQTQAVFDEIRDWFFEGYVPTWVAAGAGSEADPRSVI